MTLRILCSAVSVFGFLVLSVVPVPARTVRVSLGSDGELPDLDCSGPVLSTDGRFVAFSSLAGTLVPSDTDGVGERFELRDIFVRDTMSGTTELASLYEHDDVASGSDPIAMSGDGRFLAYQTVAVLTEEGWVSDNDVVYRDRTTGTTTALTSSGNISNSSAWSMSPDGRYLTFATSAAVIPADTNSDIDVYVWDSNTTATERVSVSTAGVQADSDSFVSSISADGRFVAFSSYASNLVVGDTNGVPDVFVRDRVMNTTERISVSDAEAQSNDDSSGPVISQDGRYVAFHSAATNLVMGDTNFDLDVFIRDRTLGTTKRLSVSTSSVQGNNDSFGIALSTDGRFAAFTSLANNLVTGDTNAVSDVFVRDQLMGTTTRVSLSDAGAQANAANFDATISPDGRVVAFASDASNLVPGDTNDVADIYAVADCAGTVCGDGTVTTICERCDDSNLVDNDGCDSNCQPTSCGNGVMTTGEPCDDGNNVDGDGCDSDCTLTGCGNGIRTAGEACDVGADIIGDYCSGDCSLDLNNLISGGGSKSTDCYLEWWIPPVTARDGKGFPARKISCKDDDPACDFGAATGDQACTFRVGLCFHVTDSRLEGACGPNPILGVGFKSPKLTGRADAADVANRAALESVFGELAELSYACTKPAGSKGFACTANSDCDGEVEGDGVCGTANLTVSPAITVSDRCSSYVDLVVPLKAGAAGKRKILLAAEGFPDDSKPLVDKDSLKLSCTP